MTNWKLRLLSLSLAAALFCAVPAPVLAAEATGGSGWVETLLEVPILGKIVRMFTGGDDTAAAEQSATSENATAETATPETANLLQVTPETAWSAVTAAWMQGTVQAGVAYPQGSADAAVENSTLGVQQWAEVTLVAGATMNPACREETNLGDLAADAAANAAAAWLWQQEDETVSALRGLPVVALVNGGSLTGNAAAGATLADAAACMALDTTLAMVQVTPQKLFEMLNTGLQGMNDSQSETYGGFWQVSGLRACYQTTDNEPRFVEVSLSGGEGENGIPLDAQDNESTLLVVLPVSMLDRCGVNAEAGYTNYLTEAGLTLAGAVTALPQNVNAETLTAILSRGGSTGRVLPVSAAQTYDAVVQLGEACANKQISFLLDGAARTAATDAQGCLTVTGLTAGAHTFAMAAGEPAYYLSNLTFVGTGDVGATAVTVVNVPESCVQDLPATPAPTATPTATATAAPTATPAPAATPAASAAPEASPTPAPQTVTVTSPDDPDPTPVPTSTPVPAAAATPKPTAKATAAPVKDPTEGLLDKTPAPTLEPTPTPSPTPEPTPDPETLEKQENLRETSSMLPLYIGIGVVLVGGVTAAVLVLRSRGDDGRTYRRRRK